MKVIYLLHAATKYGGANKSFYYMLKSLIKKGIEPVVILPEQGSLCGDLLKENINYKIIPYYLSIYPLIRVHKRIIDGILFFPRLLRMLLYNFIAITKLKKIIQEYSPEIIHTNVGPLHIGFYLSRKLNIPHIWHLREYQELDFNMHPFPSMRSFRKKLQFNNNYCVAITQGIFDYFSLSYYNSKVIYNGVLNASDGKFIKKKEKYFLYAGRLEPNKGIQNLIESFITVTQFNKEYKLYIAGDTNDNQYKNILYNIVKYNKAEDRVLFLGMRDDIYALMGKATALIVPSKFEGFGRITAEAMFNGCLVIGHNTAGTKEILELESLGLLYSSNEELIQIMLNIINCGIGNYYSIILQAQKRAGVLYSIDQNVNRIFDFYVDILKWFNIIYS